ncbi:MAG: PIN domain-containing protein [Ruminococcus sp.]|jgi:predicted nucleic-acid-binding protein|nr:PIN domain-containing protein [Ruminococcus sp.]
MVILDANVVLRHILNDNEQMADETDRILVSNNCFVPTEVIAEIVYVLGKVYKIPRGDVRDAILSFFVNNSVSCADFNVVNTGLSLFAETNFDFVDCLLVGYSRAGHKVFTFDKKLKRKLEGEAG